MSVAGTMEVLLTCDASQIPKEMADTIAAINGLPAKTAPAVDQLGQKVSGVAQTIRETSAEFERMARKAQAALQITGSFGADTARVQIASIRAKAALQLGEIPLGDHEAQAKLRADTETRIAEVQKRAALEALELDKQRSRLAVVRATQAEKLAATELAAAKTDAQNSPVQSDKSVQSVLSAEANLRIAQANRIATEEQSAQEIAAIKLRGLAIEKEMTAQALEREAAEKQAAADRIAAAEAEALSMHEARHLTHSMHRMMGGMMGMQMMTSGLTGDQEMNPASLAKMLGSAGMMTMNPYGMVGGMMLAGVAEAWEAWNKDTAEAEKHLIAVQEAAGKAAKELRIVMEGDGTLVSQLEKALKLLRENEAAAQSWSNALNESIRLSHDAQAGEAHEQFSAEKSRLDASEKDELAALRPGDRRGEEEIKHKYAQKRGEVDAEELKRSEDDAATLNTDHLDAAQSDAGLAAKAVAEHKAQLEKDEAARKAAQAAEATAGAKVRQTNQEIADAQAAAEKYAPSVRSVQSAPVSGVSSGAPATFDRDPGDPEKYAAAQARLKELQDRQAQEISDHTAKQEAIKDPAEAVKKAKEALLAATQKQAEAENKVLALQGAQADIQKKLAAQKDADAAKNEADAAAENLRHKQALQAMHETFHMPTDAMTRVGFFIQGRGQAATDHNREIAKNTADAAQLLRELVSREVKHPSAHYAE